MDKTREILFNTVSFEEYKIYNTYLSVDPELEDNLDSMLQDGNVDTTDIKYNSNVIKNNIFKTVLYKLMDLGITFIEEITPDIEYVKLYLVLNYDIRKASYHISYLISTILNNEDLPNKDKLGEVLKEFLFTDEQILDFYKNIKDVDESLIAKLKLIIKTNLNNSAYTLDFDNVNELMIIKDVIDFYRDFVPVSDFVNSVIKQGAGSTYSYYLHNNQTVITDSISKLRATIEYDLNQTKTMLNFINEIFIANLIDNIRTDKEEGSLLFIGNEILDNLTLVQQQEDVVDGLIKKVITLYTTKSYTSLHNKLMKYI